MTNRSRPFANRLLVIDRDLTVRDMVETIARPLGYQVTAPSRLSEGRLDGELPTLILLGYHDSLEIAQSDRGIGAPAAAILEKPLRRSAVRELLQKHLIDAPHAA